MFLPSPGASLLRPTDDDNSQSMSATIALGVTGGRFERDQIAYHSDQQYRPTETYQ